MRKTEIITRANILVGKFNREFSKYLRKVNLTFNEWSILKLMNMVDEPIQAKVIVRELNLPKGTVSGLVRKLLEKKFILEVQNEEDKREIFLSLNNESCILCCEVLVVENQFNKKVFKNFTDEELEHLEKLLKQIEIS